MITLKIGGVAFKRNIGEQYSLLKQPPVVVPDFGI